MTPSMLGSHLLHPQWRYPSLSSGDSLHLVLASFNDLMFVSMAVPGQVMHLETKVLTCLVHDLIEFSMASVALFEFVAFLFLGIDHEFALTLMILLG